MILSDKVDQNHNATSIAHNQAMVMFTCICDKFKITPDQTPQNNKATQHPNYLEITNSSDSHQTPKSLRASSIPNQQNSNTNFQNIQL